MAEIVDCSFKFWHGNCLGLAVQICSNDFVKYADQSLVFFLDIVQYHCSMEGCGIIHANHYGQIIFFGHDCRPYSLTLGQPILKVWLLVGLKSVQSNNCGKQKKDEMILLEHSYKYITAGQIVTHWPDISFSWKKKLAFIIYSVCWIFDSHNGKTRFVDLLLPIQAELELEAFGRNYLSLRLVKNVKLFPIVIFIDDFGLYQNMYRLTGVYAMPTGLSTLKK